MKTERKLKLPKRGIWGGYEVMRVGGCRPYYWFGQGNKYIMALTACEVKRLVAFLKK